MLSELADKMERRISRSIDFIEIEQALRAVKASLSAVRQFLNATIVEIHLLEEKHERANDDPDKIIGTKKVFCRFSYDVDERLRETDRYRTEDYEHNPLKKKGYWQWVYKYQLPLWIASAENTAIKKFPDNVEAVRNWVFPLPKDTYRMDNLRHIEEKYIEQDWHPAYISCQKYDKLFEGIEGSRLLCTRSLVVIPFKHKIENSDGIWGFLDIEFAEPTPYNQKQYEALGKLADNIATIIWKANAWSVNKQGTLAAVEDFERDCQKMSTALRIKTALFLLDSERDSERAGSRIVEDLITRACEIKYIKVNKIMLKEKFGELLQVLPTYTLRCTQGLEAEEPDFSRFILEHFAIVDITSYDTNPEVLLLLGLAISLKKPCCIIHEKDDKSVEDHIPDVIEVALAAAGGYRSNIIRSYSYKESTDGNTSNVVFYNEKKEIVNWEEEWRNFLESVEESSSAYRVACSWFSI